MSNFDWAVQCVLHHEGGYVNHPSDPGGATNWGISLRYLQSIGDLNGDGLIDGDLDGDGDVDWQDIKLMSRDQAVEFYRLGFWLPSQADKIQSALVATKYFDMAVNMGRAQATRIVQRACNDMGATLNVDGGVGPNTLNAVNFRLIRDFELVTLVRAQQAAFYEALIVKTPKFKDFKLGWRRRAAF